MANTLADRLRAARKEKGLTQTELAKKAGLAHQSNIGNLESGRHGSSTQLHAIAAALGVKPAWLETGRGPKSATEETQPLTNEQQEWLGTWEWLTETQRKAAMQLAEENRRAFGKGGPPEPKPEATAPPSRRTGTR